MGLLNRQLSFIKISIYCLYLSATYWISLHFPPLAMLFYPSLGSFSVILMHNKSYKNAIYKILIGATTTSSIGSILYFIYPSIVTFFITAFVTLWFMQRFDWTAAPILAVALIPFFSYPQSIWVLPLSVFCSLIGLIFPLWLIQKLENPKQFTKKDMEEVI